MHTIQNNLKTTGITFVLTIAEDFLKSKIITNEKDLFSLISLILYYQKMK